MNKPAFLCTLKTVCVVLKNPAGSESTPVSAATFQCNDTVMKRNDTARIRKYENVMATPEKQNAGVRKKGRLIQVTYWLPAIRNLR
ncbi:hypothetical protein DR864_28425 (plasmid) [Runella rosea]|uniref:Uncharacterized protein n=1 Tax=Runella rosea TaxID=2259595 RepID=A0A344TT31_9BACT|nr:hypothetical protein DR864_28425 [Runella rosea]